MSPGGGHRPEHPGRGGFQIPSCRGPLRIEEDFAGVILSGRRFHIGTPEVYGQTLIDFRDA